MSLSQGMIMRAYIWNDGRVLGFDAVEWLTWAAVVGVLGLMTLAM